jgi:starch-binding outer membrane protein SusE/F
MKKSFKFLLSATLFLTMLAACKKNQNQVFYEGGTAPVLAISSTAALVLNIANSANQALAFTWTNPNYKFTTGPSSQNVTYILQIDTTGSNFTNPAVQEFSISNDLSFSMTVKELNTTLTKLGLAENITHNVEFRVKSTLINKSAALYSNVIKKVITPYLDVVYPVPTALWITGSATPLSWQCGCATDVGTTQKFTKVNSTKFELTLALSANNSYLFLPQYGSWSAKYGFTGSNNGNNVNGDDFKPEGGDMKAPATSGTYKITVEFKTGKWTIQ